MSDASGSAVLARRARTALLPTLDTLQKLESSPPFAERALESVARAISALYEAETESPTESAVSAGLRAALEELSQALEALHEAPGGWRRLESETAAVARALAELYPAVRTSQRQRREVVMPGMLASDDNRALVEMGNRLAAPEPSERPRVTQSFTGATQRRADERQAVHVDVGLLSESNFYTGLSEDVSEGGVFVATLKPLPIGTAVTLFFTLDEGPSVEVAGIVRWLRLAERDLPPGMGVAFATLRDEDRLAIVRYAASRPPFFHP